MVVTWVFEEQVFPHTTEHFREAVRALGHRFMSWRDQ